MAVEVRSDIGGIWLITASVDPASATTDTIQDVTITHADVRANDIIVPVAAATAESGVVPICCHTVTAGSFKVRIANPTAGTVNGASLTWSFLVFRR